MTGELWAIGISGGALLVAMFNFIYNIGRESRALEDTNKRLEKVEQQMALAKQAQDDDRKQAGHFATTVAREYISRAEFAALDNRVMDALSELNRKVDNLTFLLIEQKRSREQA